MELIRRLHSHKKITKQTHHTGLPLPSNCSAYDSFYFDAASGSRSFADQTDSDRILALLKGSDFGDEYTKSIQFFLMFLVVCNF